MRNCTVVTVGTKEIKIKVDEKATHVELIESLKKKMNKLKDIYEDEKLPIRFAGKILRIKEMEEIFDKASIGMRKYSSDFGEISYAEFLWLAGECLEVGTYDSLICPEYPCTSEILCNGKFSYYEIGDETNEIIIDSPEKCWEYLKESYDALED